MPTPLTDNSTFEESKAWLLKNLNGCIIPEQSNLINVPKSKGIYFWFMKPEGYEALSGFIPLEEISTLVVKDGRHLVYVGTAGTGKKGNSHLFERLKWHISQTHTSSAICSGTLSTFRTGLGSLLSNDLINCTRNNTESGINTLFKKYFVVCWVSFSEKKIIDKYEKILIDTLRPLFNIQNNANAGNIDHLTFAYKKRRSFILKETQSRLGCANKLKSNRKMLKETNVTYQGKIYTISLEGQKTKVWDQNGIEEKNMRKLFREIISENGLDVQLDNSNGVKKTTQQLAMEIIRHYNRGNSGETRITSSIDSRKEKSPGDPKNKLVFPRRITGKTLIILNCTDTKNNKGTLKPNIDFFDAQNPLLINRNVIAAANPGRVINSDQLMRAIDRYNGLSIQGIRNCDGLIARIDEMHKKGCLEIIFVSAYFGVIDYNKNIPEYDLTIGLTLPIWGDSVENAVVNFIREKGIINVFNFVSNEYNNLFPNMRYVWREWPIGQGYNNLRSVGSEWVRQVINAQHC